MSYQKTISATLVVVCVLACSPVMLLGQDTAQLIDVLRSEAPLFEKAKACQRLSIIGDETAVPALMRLLDHEQLSNYARCGLEGIPHASADAALREAVSSLKGARLVGVLNSIGARGDARHAAMYGVEAVRALNEVGGRLAAAADAGKLDNHFRFLVGLVNGVDQAGRDQVVAATDTEG